MPGGDAETGEVLCFTALPAGDAEYPIGEGWGGGGRAVGCSLRRAWRCLFFVMFHHRASLFQLLYIISSRAATAGRYRWTA